jgi:ubiquinone/menaquinone biosynthesis C-methylase UbiE
MNFSSGRVQYIFDQMGRKYDLINDLWYSWLYSRLHYLIAKEIICSWSEEPRKVIDIGCGTGFQSFLYAQVGAEVWGIDISPKLIEVATEKSKYLPSVANLFQPQHKFVEYYNKKIERLLFKCFPNPNVTKPRFEVQSILDLKFQNEEFDHVNCCGSVLSLLEDHQLALHHISRVLKPGGTFVLEVEAKYNFDLIWNLLDSITGGTLGYESTFKEAIQPFLTKRSEYYSIEYPFGERGEPVYMPIKLYTRSGLAHDLLRHNLVVNKWQSIHSVTNLIPSTILDSEKPLKFMRPLFRGLSVIEELIPKSLPGCSIVAIGEKLVAE